MIGIGRKSVKIPRRMVRRRWSTAMLSMRRMLSVTGRITKVEMNSIAKMRMLIGRNAKPIHGPARCVMKPMPCACRP